VSCLQQSGTDRYAEAEACSTKQTQKGMFGKYVDERKLNDKEKNFMKLRNLTLQARVECLIDHFHRQIIGMSLISTHVKISNVM
jgi:hypothetical protein